MLRWTQAAGNKAGFDNALVNSMSGSDLVAASWLMAHHHIHYFRVYS